MRFILSFISKITTYMLVLLFSGATAFSQSSGRVWLQLELAQGKTCPIEELVDSVEQAGVEVVHKSQWLCAVSVNEVSLPDEVVTTTRPVTSLVMADNGDQQLPEPGKLIEALQPEVFQRAQLDGKGVVIGIIDAGFDGADSNAIFKHIFSDDRVLGYKDFVTPGRENQDFFDPEFTGDYHGMKVWGFLGGLNTEKNKQIGLATGASYYLARTENAEKEHRVEEDAWIEALEWMYEQDVRLINTSLGYSEFDDPSENYVRSDMNGRTAMISRAAEIAVEEKGMTIVVSAGNMGRGDWKVITAPADVEGVLSIGATNRDVWSKAGYSSQGVDFVDFIKPNVSSPSNRGTSYSSPAICGFVACLLQAKPELTNKEVMEIVEMSSHLYPYGNNYVGYGVPQAGRAIELLKGNLDTLENRYEYHPESKKKKIVVELWGDPGKDLVLFHKENSFVCLYQSVVRYSPVAKIKRKDKYFSKRGKHYVRLYRKKDVTRTTISAGDEVVEVIWDEI